MNKTEIEQKLKELPGADLLSVCIKKEIENKGLEKTMPFLNSLNCDNSRTMKDLLGEELHKALFPQGNVFLARIDNDLSYYSNYIRTEQNPDLRQALRDLIASLKQLNEEYHLLILNSKDESNPDRRYHL